MRKVISLFLAAAVLCLSTSAMANPTAGTVSGTLTNGSSGTRNAVTAFGNSDAAASMPCFRPGDTISFNVESVISGEELTVISYKNGETPDDTTVQYINQYTLSSSSQSISYTIRNQDSGVYMLKFTGSTSGTATFYYKVGKATVDYMSNANPQQGNNSSSKSIISGSFSAGTSVSDYGTPYIMKQRDDDNTWSIGFVARVNVDSGDISLSDIGAKPGFAIKEGSGTAKQYGFGKEGQKTVANLESTRNLEIAGSYSLIYGLTLYNVTDNHQNSISAQAVLDVQ